LGRDEWVAVDIGQGLVARSPSDIMQVEMRAGQESIALRRATGGWTATISHFMSQLGALMLSRRSRFERSSESLSIVSAMALSTGVGETLAGVVLAELPGSDVLRSSARATGCMSQAHW
jgi:hypothetical protein